jgi:hypothetical protein
MGMGKKRQKQLRTATPVSQVEKLYQVITIYTDFSIYTRINRINLASIRSRFGSNGLIP